VGFIGCGRATASLHLPALRHVAGAEVLALADISRGVVEDVARRFGVATFTTDPRVLIEDPRLDAIAVCVPPSLHADLGVAVLSAGKHLFLEKPLALTLDDCDRLVNAAGAAPSRTAMVGFNLRHHRRVRRARALVLSGGLGRIDAIRTVWTSAIRMRGELPAWRDSRASGGGVLFEIGVHHFDLWRSLLGLEVDEIHAFSYPGGSLDEVAAVSARLSGGVLASSLFSERTADQNEIEIQGSTARLRFSIYRFDPFEVVASSGSAGGVDRRAEIVAFLRDLPGALRIQRQGGDFLRSYRNQWEHFVDAVRRGGAVESPLSDGREAVRLALAAIESAGAGRPVVLARSA
jgi:myo-inositol 2-dehydrogenase/D-chiro-inositol 1-dehydrogenase